MHENIILETLQPGYQPLPRRYLPDYSQNMALLNTYSVFSEGAELPISIKDLALLYQPGIDRGRPSRPDLAARDAGEMMRWSIENGVIKAFEWSGCIHFRLLEREPLYIVVGPSTNRRQVRVRRWRSAEEERLSLKEMKREEARIERARVKEVSKLKTDAEHFLSEILARDVDVDIRGTLEDFAVPGVSKLVEIKNHVLGSMDDMDPKTAQGIVLTLKRQYSEVLSLPLPEPALEIQDEDLDILAKF